MYTGEIEGYIKCVMIVKDVDTEFVFPRSAPVRVLLPSSCSCHRGEVVALAVCSQRDTNVADAGPEMIS